jgi:hypothetical protein
LSQDSGSAIPMEELKIFAPNFFRAKLFRAKLFRANFFREISKRKEMEREMSKNDCKRQRNGTKWIFQLFLTKVSTFVFYC